MQTSKPEAPKRMDRSAPPSKHLPPLDTVTHKPSRGLTAVSAAVRVFLTAEFQAREIRVTRIAALAGPDEGWEAEAEILVPDLAIKTLGLQLTQEVLECRRYVVLLNDELTITGYEPLDS
jgi:hypothetical protein